MESWMVAYDISDPKRLRRVARACEDYGTRKQLSVFLVRVPAKEIEKLRGRLQGLIRHGEGQVLFVPLCAKCVVKMEAVGARDVVVV